MPRLSDLPGDLKSLVRRNAVEISHTRFNADSERLIAALERVFEKIAAEQREREEKARLEAERREIDRGALLETERRQKVNQNRLEPEQRQREEKGRREAQGPEHEEKEGLETERRTAKEHFEPLDRLKEKLELPETEESPETENPPLALPGKRKLLWAGIMTLLVFVICLAVWPPSISDVRRISTGLTGSADSTARIWDLNVKDPAASAVILRGHQKRVTAVAISPGAAATPPLLLYAR